MPGLIPGILFWKSAHSLLRHCEERSDEAIQPVSAVKSLDCFASLARTALRALVA